MSADLKGEWTLHMGEADEKFDLKLEENFTDITITLPHTVILNKTVEVTCKVSGGDPRTNASDITFMLMDSENNTISGSEERFSKSSTDSTDTGEDVEVTRTFTPKLEDQGLRPCCKAVQKDGDKDLYSANKVQPNLKTRHFCIQVCILDGRSP